MKESNQPIRNGKKQINYNKLMRKSKTSCLLLLRMNNEVIYNTAMKKLELGLKYIVIMEAIHNFYEKSETESTIKGCPQP